MSSVYLYVSPFQPYSVTRFWETLQHGVRREMGASLIIVSSSALKESVRHHFFRDTVSGHGIPDVMTLDEVVFKLVRVHVNRIACFDKVLVRWVLQMAIEGPQPVLSGIDVQEAFPYWSRLSGYLDQVLSFFGDLGRYQIDDSIVLGAVSGSKKKMYQTLITAYGDYRKRREDQGVEDVLLGYRLAADVLEEEWTGFLRGRSVYLMGFWDVPPYQQDVLDRILSLSQVSSVLLYYQKGVRQYDAARVFYEWLVRRKGGVRELPESRSGDMRDNKIEKLGCASIDQEIEAVFDSILSWVMPEAGAQGLSLTFCDIGIVVPDRHSYMQGLAEGALKRGIPMKMSCDVVFTQHPIGEWFQALLSLVQSSWTREKVLVFLKAPFVQDLVCDDGVSRPIRLAFLHSVTEEMPVGSEAWLAWFSQKREWLDRVLTQGVAPDKKMTFSQYSEWLDEQASVIETLFLLLERIRESGSVREFVQALQHAIHGFGIRERVLRLTGSERFLNECHNHDRFRGAVGVSQCVFFELINRLESFVQFCEGFGRHRPFVLSDVIEDLGEVLSEPIVMAPGGDRQGVGVEVFGKFESVSVVKKAWIVVGAVEGQWPAVMQENVFLPEALRSRLMLPLASRYYDWDCYLFFSLLNQATDLVRIFYPVSVRDIPTVPSHYVGWAHDYYGLSEFEQGRVRLDLGGVTRPSLGDDALRDKRRDLYRQRIGRVEEKGQRLLLNPIALNVLREQIRGFSVSGLELYQKCPYHFFFKEVLKQEGMEAISEEVSATIWGTLIHDIMYRFYTQFPEAFGCSDIYRYETSLFQIAQTVFEQYSEGSFFWDVKRTVLFGNDHGQGVLSAILREEARNPMPFQVKGVEAPFKREGKVTLTGKIDVVLQTADKAWSAVLDYKTGARLSGKSDVETFRHLQLPVYLMAIKRAFPESQVAGGVFYLLRQEQSVEKVVVCVDQVAKKQVFDVGRKRPYVFSESFWSDLDRHVGRLMDGILSGEFGVELPDYLLDMTRFRPNFCQSCSYIYNCRFPKRFSQYG